MATTCLCGAVVEGRAEADEHFRTVHPDLQLTEQQVENWLAAGERLTGSIERLPSIGSVETVDASAERLPDILDFFDHHGFADNPIWASCYCAFHHLGGASAEGWLDRAWTANREVLAERVANGSTTAALAYVDGRMAGWCNASLRAAFPEHLQGGDDRVGVVMCFVIAPPYRRHGVARRLLEHACEAFARRGLDAVEAYPRRHAAPFDGGSYHGPLSMYLDAGFEEVREHDGVVVVRRELR